MATELQQPTGSPAADADCSGVRIDDESSFAPVPIDEVVEITLGGRVFVTKSVIDELRSAIRNAKNAWGRCRIGRLID